jgi:lysine 2,3-aminomutase
MENVSSSHGPWAKVDPQDWNDWKWQIRSRIQSLDTLSSLLSLTEEEEEGCRIAQGKLLFAITPYFFTLIDIHNPDCPIRKQVIPRAAEGRVASDEKLDPLGEEAYMKVPGLVQRYPDRVLFLVTNCCASYCRYCTRSRLVSNACHSSFQPSYEKGLQYIRENPSIRDVLLSGGDPLLLPNSQIEYLLAQLRAIPHVEMIRIGTRAPIFLPQRITTELCDIFKKYGPIWMSIHTNHPRECTEEMKEACRRLSTSHVILGNQSVLLRGVNDSPAVMRSLCHRLLQMGVRPYYLHQCDLIIGSSHFRTCVREGIDIIEQMRGHTSGYAVPQFVIDTPGRGGKVAVNPQTVKEVTETHFVLKNFRGEEYVYPKDSGDGG